MNDHVVPCEWLERVSAHLDGELAPDQEPLVVAHSRQCEQCSAVLTGDQQITARREARVGSEPSWVANLPTRLSRPARAALVAVGILIVIGSTPDFVRGNTRGDALHDLRHLAMWQVAIGLSALSAAITFRLSRILAVLMSSFLLLTLVAVVYDVVTGHRGPWTDPTHVIEVLAGLLVLKLTWPLIRPVTRPLPTLKNP